MVSSRHLQNLSSHALQPLRFSMNSSTPTLTGYPLPLYTISVLTVVTVVGASEDVNIAIDNLPGRLFGAILPTCFFGTYLSPFPSRLCAYSLSLSGVFALCILIALVFIKPVPKSRSHLHTSTSV